MQTQISLDFILITRCLSGLLWGILLACFLQYHHFGQFLARERAWITVVIGVGGDLLLGIEAEWWVIWLIIAGSSLGIIVRSLSNERETDPMLNKYKVKWAMEHSIDSIGDIIGALEKALISDEAERARFISIALSAAHKAMRNITFARYGEVEKK